jgi:hypothetical protein
MDLLRHRTDQELLASCVAEIAKSTNEIRCSQADLSKAQSRLSFVLAVINEIINRNKDQKI